MGRDMGRSLWLAAVVWLGLACSFDSAPLAPRQSAVLSPEDSRDGTSGSSGQPRGAGMSTGGSASRGAGRGGSASDGAGGASGASADAGSASTAGRGGTGGQAGAGMAGRGGSGGAGSGGAGSGGAGSGGAGTSGTGGEPEPVEFCARLLNAGKPCDDGQFCTTGERCLAGFCTGGTATSCAQFNDACHIGVCDPGSQQCLRAAANVGQPCDDSNAC